MRVLFDAEPNLFRAAAGSEYEIEFQQDCWTYICNHSDAKTAFDADITRVLELVPDAEIMLVFGDSNNFRYAVYPEYKGNRRKQRRPAGYTALREWAMGCWPSQLLPNVEGDDALGILYRGGDIIYSRDKDLKTVPGLHLRESALEEIDEQAANLAFYCQALSGDATDGYPGCPGIGPVTAAKLLADCTSELEMWSAVVEAYLKAGKTVEFALQMARCARILRAGEYDRQSNRPVLWNPPVH